jgi:glycosyltransferase involved in cell wall biosynthesis
MNLSGKAKYRWAVLNQSQSPFFQQMIERLATDLGPCLLYTGMPVNVKSDNLTVKKAPAYNRSSLPQRALSWGAYLIGAASNALLLDRDTFLLAVTNPPMLPNLTWALAALKKTNYAILVWDVYPEHLVQIGWLAEKSLPVRIWRELNRRALKRADLVITIGEGMAASLAATAGTDVRIEVIPNWADTEQLKPIVKKDNPFAVEHGLVDKLTVIYSGNIGATHNFTPILEAAGILSGNKNIEFLFIGDGLGEPKLKRNAEIFGLTNVTFLPFQPWETVPFSLAAGDLAIVSQAAGSEHLSVPSKTYSMIAAGNALLAITAPGTDLANMVNQHNLGRSFDGSNPAEIAHYIESLANDRSLLAGIRARARSAAVEYYSTEAIYRRFHEVLEPLLVLQSKDQVSSGNN